MTNEKPYLPITHAILEQQERLNQLSEQLLLLGISHYDALRLAVWIHIEMGETGMDFDETLKTILIRFKSYAKRLKV